MNGTIVNNVKTALLMATLGAIIVGAGAAMGGRGGASIALIIALGMNLIGYFFSAKIALASVGAVEVGPDHELYRLVEPLAQRAGLPMPRVYVSPEQAPNAFATGRGPNSGVVCATEGLLRLLNRNEVAGVMAHELAHIRHRDILTSTIAASLGTAVSYLGHMFMFGGGRDENGNSNSNPIAGLLVMILGPITAGIVQMAISRQREFAADTEGGRIVGDPMYLATALEKVHAYAHGIPLNAPPSMNAMMIAEPKNNFGGSVANLFSTHPPLEKRLMNLIGRESTGMVRLAR
ncbi:MAG: M48 family metalloprotease [Tepidisphaeraceae bacterium]